MKAKTLTSKRLVLNRLTTEHISPEYVAWLNDNEVNKYLETRGGYSLEKLKDFLIEQEKNNILFWAIHLKETNEHIGNIKIDPINALDASGEYGILMGEKKHWGKGYAKEASRLVIDYCFAEIGLKQITLGVISNNKNAVKIYRQMGFDKVSVTEGYGIYDGQTCDLIRMVLSNDKK